MARVAMQELGHAGPRRTAVRRPGELRARCRSLSAPGICRREGRVHKILPDPSRGGHGSRGHGDEAGKMVSRVRSAKLVFLLLVTGCGASHSPARATDHAPAAPTAAESAKPAETTSKPASTPANEAALARLTPSLQAVIRAALRRGIEPRSDVDAAPRTSVDCDTAHRVATLEPGGVVIAGCHAALWLDENGSLRGYREAVEVVGTDGRVAAFLTNRDHAREASFAASADGATVSVPLDDGERIGSFTVRGSSFVAERVSADEARARWVAGLIPERALHGEERLVPVDGAREDESKRGGDTPTEGPFDLSLDGQWLLQKHLRRLTAHQLTTGRRFDLPAICTGSPSFFDVEPTTLHLYVAVSPNPIPWRGPSRYCELDPVGHLLHTEELKPSGQPRCAGEDTCSRTLDHVWLGGLVLSSHVETGLGAMPSELRGSRSAAPISMIDFRPYPDRIEGLDRRGDRWILLTLRNEAGKLARVEKIIDDAFVERWHRGAAAGPRYFDYCIVSGVPIPFELCPTAEEFASIAR